MTAFILIMRLDTALASIKRLLKSLRKVRFLRKHITSIFAQDSSAHLPMKILAPVTSIIFVKEFNNQIALSEEMMALLNMLNFITRKQQEVMHWCNFCSQEHLPDCYTIGSPPIITKEPKGSFLFAEFVVI
ncbi:hypothetical protein CJF43_17440 [Pseudomonas fragi]|uniref:Uncharacterized protein n=1 Tax=Pseudomonas fragi TaxID=296 RepID=A0A266LR93_PSEFR|nr:hypothetical protein CJF36_21735 [Pseudomonas lundensis]OZY40618.1 hypothetical protein CJF43_17440 [Pseudomonas fragi]